MKFVKKYYPYAILGLIIICLLVFFPKNNNNSNTNPFGVHIEEPQENDPEYIYVDIKGQIKYPGVYKIETGNRLFQLISIAGGVTVDADTNRINLSMILSDETSVYIPAYNEVTTPIDIIDNVDESLININKATQLELETLPGVGPSTALKIIAYREEHGPFNEIEEILLVSGIGESTFNEIKDLITV